MKNGVTKTEFTLPSRQLFVSVCEDVDVFVHHRKVLIFRLWN